MENINITQSQIENNLSQTTIFLQMFVEKYLGYENSTFNKMSLEVTSAWECRTIVGI